MELRLTGRELFRRGEFNACNVLPQPDGSTVYACSGEKAPAPFFFQVRGLGTAAEEVLYNPVVEPRRSG